MLLEQIDEPERRGIVFFADFCRGLSAHLLRKQAPDGLLQHQLLPPGRALRAPLLQHGFPRRPAKIVMRRHQLIDEAHAAGGARTQHASRQHRTHGIERAGDSQRADGAVEAGEDAELHFGEAEACVVFAVRNTPMAGERQLEPAAKAIAVDGGDDRDRQILDAVEQFERGLHHLLDALFGIEALEFADVGTDEEAGRLRAHQDEAFDLAGATSLFRPCDDLGELFGEASPERVHLLALTIHQRPGDPFVIHRKSPVVQTRLLSLHGVL